MLCREALKRLNEWFGLYIADEKHLKANEEYATKHKDEDAYKFLRKHENSIDSAVHQLAAKSQDNDFSREFVQSLMTDSNVALGLNLRYTIFAEYLEENPNKEIILSDFEPQFILDCFVNYPRELIHPNSLL